MREFTIVIAMLVCGCAAPPEVGEEALTPATPPLPSTAKAQREAPASEPAAAPELASGFAPATRGSGACVVTVSQLLEAEEYRGPGPITPAVAASLDADPEFARAYNGMSHGDLHIQCHYAVELEHTPGQRYRWREVHGNTFGELTPAVCDTLAAEVAVHIIESTKQCTQLDAGAYWGYVLEALP